MVKKNNFYVVTGIGILIGLLSWTIYSIINKGVQDLLIQNGIDSFYLRAGIILVIGLGILFIFGIKGKKAIKRVVK